MNFIKFTTQTKENLDVIIVGKGSMSILILKFTNEFTQEKETSSAMIVEKAFQVPAI